VHRLETDVRSVPDTDKDARMKALDRLRNLGDFQHNVDVLTKGHGELIIGRRVPGDKFGADDFLPCRYCLTFFYRRELWRHVAHCNFKMSPLTTDGSSDKQAQRAGQMLLHGAGVGITTSALLNADFMAAVINLLPNDEVSTNITNDCLLTQYGQILFNKLGCERAADIRCRLRYLSRLKLKSAVRGGYDSLLNSEHFDTVVGATKELCVIATDKTLNGTTKFQKPHIALKVGQFLRKICQVSES